MALYADAGVRKRAILFALMLFALLMFPAISAWAIDPPTNLEVVAEPDPSPNINITWSPAGGAVEYNVYRGLSQLTNPNQAEKVVKGIAATNFTDDSGVPGETYFYQVTAVDDLGNESVFSVGIITDSATVSGSAYHNGFSDLGNACSNCHKAHRAPYVEKLLRKGPEDEVCYTCHDGTGAEYNIREGFEGQSSHDTQLAGKIGSNIKCGHCHFPHGVGFSRMTILKEENLCFACHSPEGASPADNISYLAPNIKTVFDLFEVLNDPANGVYYAHPISRMDLHDPILGLQGENADGGSGYQNMGAGNRHVECTDCHDPHTARAGTHTFGTNLAPAALRGASGVAVTNGQPGTIPIYTFVGAATYEYELCFKCHSSFNLSWNSAPGLRRDKAIEFNTNNPSYHPVEGIGKNLGIQKEAFAIGTPWRDNQTGYDGVNSPNISCSDCHASNNAADPGGAHGSGNQHILKKYYARTAFWNIDAAAELDLCFSCHSYEVYYNGAPGSRFERHRRYVQDHKVSCYTCHAVHGSSNHEHLIKIKEPAEVDGILTFAHNAGGGECGATCHGPQTYNHAY